MAGVAPVVVDGDGLVGVGHHRYEHVEEDNDATHGVEAEH